MAKIMNKMTEDQKASLGIPELEMAELHKKFDEYFAN